MKTSAHLTLSMCFRQNSMATFYQYIEPQPHITGYNTVVGVTLIFPQLIFFCAFKIRTVKTF